jgi:O-antigen/teichoic acid export membrane protein
MVNCTLLKKRELGRMKIFARDSVLVFVSDIFSNALKFLTVIIIAKILGSSGQSVYSIVMQIVAFSVMFGSFGTEITIIYFIGQKKYPVKSIVGNGFAFALLSSLCLENIEPGKNLDFNNSPAENICEIIKKF